MFPMTTLFESVESCISILWFVMETQRTVFTPYFFESFIMPFESQSIMYNKSKKQKRHHYHFLDKYGKMIGWQEKKKTIFKSLLSGSRSFTFIQTHVDL